jgi:hypothetical protein
MSISRPLLLVIGAVAAAAITLSPLPLVFTLAFALLLVFVLPGSALVEAFDSGQMTGLPRIVLVPSLSIAVVIAVTLLLDLTPVGLTARSWSLGIAAVVVVAALVAEFRGTPSHDVSRPVAIRVRTLDVVAALVAAGLLAGAVVLVRTPLTASKAQGYTALSLVHGAGRTVRVEVRSGEIQPTTYRLDVRAGDRLLYRNPSLRLEPGKSMIKVIGSAAGGEPVRATLYLGQQARVYRHADLH